MLADREPHALERPRFEKSYSAGELLQQLKHVAQPRAANGLAPVEACVLDALRKGLAAGAPNIAARQTAA